ARRPCAGARLGSGCRRGGPGALAEGVAAAVGVRAGDAVRAVVTEGAVTDCQAAARFREDAAATPAVASEDVAGDDAADDVQDGVVPDAAAEFARAVAGQGTADDGHDEVVVDTATVVGGVVGHRAAADRRPVRVADAAAARRVVAGDDSTADGQRAVVV